jgi:hypothetical protein
MAVIKKGKKSISLSPGFIKMATSCDTCYGNGMWAWGDASPMGPMDAGDGFPTIECPECGASRNPIKKTLKKVNEGEKSGKGKKVRKMRPGSKGNNTYK